MAVDFLHGVETVELNSGAVPITVVRSAVISLIGYAPKGPREALTLVQSQTDAAAFGAKIDGFTIPHALEAIQKQGSGTVMVINVFDPDVNTELITAEEQDLVSGKFKTAFQPLLELPFVAKQVTPDGADLGTDPDLVNLVVNVDYTIDDFGNFKMISGGLLSEGDTVQVSYSVFDPSTVTNSQIIGAIASGTNVRTGSKLLEEAYQQFGFTPRLFIIPGYSHIEPIAAEMIVIANKYKGHALLDAPAGTIPQDAIIGRGPSGTINFETSDKRAYLLYPMLKAYNDVNDTVELQPYSQFMAGVIAATDASDGYWASPSNRTILGIVGTERIITAAINDANTEANQLNAAGIATVFNSFGTGLRTWGNRSAAFPTSTAPSNFIAVQRVADILNESVEYSMLSFLDRPITQALIDSIRDSVNAFMNVLIQRGAIIDGICTYDPADNPPVEIAAGHLKFRNTFMPPTPAERVTFYSFIDINLLSQLGGNNNA